MEHRTAIALSIVFLSTGALRGTASDVMTGDMLRVKFAHWRESISSLSYEAEIYQKRPKARVLRQSYIAKSGLRLSEMRHFQLGLGWRDDIAWNKTLIRNGKLWAQSVFYRLCEHSTAHSSVSTNPKLVDVFEDFYLNCIGWMPEGEVPVTPMSIYASLEDHALVVCPEVTDEFGRRIIKVSRASVGFDEEISFDIEYGFAVVRHIWHNTELNTSIETKNDRFEEVAAGMWLPHRCTRIVFFGGLETHPRYDEIISEVEFEAKNISVNCFSESDFCMSLPEGTITYHDRLPSDVLAGGHELMDSVVHVIEVQFSRHVSHSFGSGGYFMSKLACGLVGFIFGGRLLNKGHERSGRI